MEVRLARAFLQFIIKSMQERKQAELYNLPFSAQQTKSSRTAPLPHLSPGTNCTEGDLNLYSSTKSRADTLNPRAEFSLSGAHRGWHQMLTP